MSTTLNLRNFFSTEAIDFQDGTYAEYITKQFEEIMRCKTAKEAQESQARNNIVDYVFKRTGVKVNLVLDTAWPPCTMLAQINNNHIFTSAIFKPEKANDTNRLLKKLKDFKGESYVDLKNAKVSGFFSTIENPIYIGFRYIKSFGITAREWAAIFTHELGHDFTVMEFFSRCALTNQVLACVLKSLQEVHSDATDSRHQYVLKELGKQVAQDEDYFTELTEVNNERVVTTVIIGKCFQENKSHTGAINYNQTTCEQLADNFATRMGLGREIVTGLAKVTKLYGYPEYMSSIAVLAVTYAPVLMTTVGMLAMGIGLPAIALTWGILALLTTCISGEATRNYTYDDLKIRFLRVREQVITSIKPADIPDDVKKKALEAISAIDKEVANIKDHFSVYRALANFVFKGSREHKKLIDIQRQLEELTANDIYVQATKLSTMGTSK